MQFGIVAILISILGSYFFYFIADNDRCVKIFSFLGINKTVNSNIFDNTIDKHHGAWLRLYISEEKIIYTGELVYVNEHEGENNYYIVLKNYKRSMYDRAIDKTYQGNKNWVIISTEKVNRIEIIHGDNSSKINDVEKNKIKKIINFFKKFLPIKK
ncbi:hypothetical protein KM799_02485 [Clostridium tyrobutyricum]|uniref:hypothetical protein n=1 Tax=Clostridium tyrobutyricum TaxID=1519 RepID=UPI001C3827C6|nr:hypothetical protein [Clostridium tyrobutyricum]MBV4440116.1 hypothetical protein [Clostridium tyrobutyricum]MBV4445322.1 hypothetical protein [Clostridium tyrobutyricum]MBV4445473.1 hypothetical protein [Clostridium tyrobutyricum]